MVEFQVLRGDAIIYSMRFPVDDASWQFSVFSKTAIDDFHTQLPEVELTDEDVSMRWVLVNADRT